VPRPDSWLRSVPGLAGIGIFLSSIFHYDDVITGFRIDIDDHVRFV
jgi:hypothetical protein